MKTWATISPRKKGELLRLVFEKRRHFAQKMNQCCLLAFFFPQKKNFTTTTLTLYLPIVVNAVSIRVLLQFFSGALDS
jgi:hypothetical protein